MLKQNLIIHYYYTVCFHINISMVCEECVVCEEWVVCEECLLCNKVIVEKRN